ncbi:MAG: EthD family reductase [Geodermatophilaceae bacterium]|nr:EthD family reductase [Geodermatophilaceae bacterium]
MAFALTALYNHPDDVAAFDAYYDGSHAPLAAMLPGMTAYSVSRPGPDAEGNPPPYHLIAVLTFPDAETFGSALGGEVGQKAVADLANFAQAGVVLMSGPIDSAM